MDNNNNYDEHDSMGFMENQDEVGLVNEEENHEQAVGYVEVQFASEDTQREQVAGDIENEQVSLSRSVKELSVLVNKVVDEITVCNYNSLIPHSFYAYFFGNMDLIPFHSFGSHAGFETLGCYSIFYSF
jgi:hypothetical protein